MEEKKRYKALMSEVIAKQAIILGPEIAVLKARNVSGITVDDNGIVTDVTGNNPSQILKKLVDEYISLSGEIVRNVMKPIFDKYPEIVEKIE